MKFTGKVSIGNFAKQKGEQVKNNKALRYCTADTGKKIKFPTMVLRMVNTVISIVKIIHGKSEFFPLMYF